ncbi:N-acetylmuramoyl-L-alanine amidase family protein [Bacillus sp. WLY-B-L8]|uniref:N-acetylmuramoyl-L-alanine amidase family protein n=1 Tax=Bacillus multifaciens TaxID=3068506 RepID=UPI0027417E60|nr:cell wall-binding protein [Bacillus sp. WLY-B-L8]MDP7978933.1 cell wall-binding protein [Bacillus sp. WLY-B-L8]
MKKNLKTTGIGKKVIPATAALGILFSMAPVAENKASAGIGTVLDVTITALGAVANIYEGLGLAPGDIEPSTTIDVYAENIGYKAPNFASGEFNISMHHTKGDSNFTKSVKVLYPNGKIEIHKLKSGQQLKITQAGIIIDLNPDAKSVSEHDLLYITQAQLDEGKTGVVMNQDHTAFVEKASGKNPRLLNPLYKKYSGDSAQDWSVIVYSQDVLFDYISNKLSNEQKQLVTLTSKPVSKDVLWNYLTSDSEALADFHDRSVNILADTTQALETSIRVGNSVLDDKPYQIIPIKKGSNKVVVKKGSEYLSGKDRTKFQYSHSIGDDEILELVPIENSDDNQFNLVNKNGERLANDTLRFKGKTNNEIHNWLREWYPGKENEKQKHDGIQIVPDEKDSRIWTAKDSSGNVIKNSWVRYGGDHYHYAGSDGVFVKGWHDVEGKTYYFGSNGAFRGMYINPDIDGKQYHFDHEGVLQKSAWLNKKYSDHTGAFVKEGIREIDGKIYYFQNYEATTNELRLEDQYTILHFDDKGVLERVTDLNGKAPGSITYVTLDEKKVAFEKDGSIRKKGVSKIFLPGITMEEKDQPTLVYYSLEEGPFYSGWKEIDGKKYHFQNGRHFTFDGHEPIDGKRYYFNQDGEAKLTGFDKVNGKIYHYNDKGEMQTGWQEINGKWYYFDESGAAKIGWFQVGGGYHFPDYGYFTYYAKEDGSIYTDTKVEINGKTYKFDSHGHKGY